MTLIEKLQQTGIHRLGSPKRGFRWEGASKRDLGRLEELKIPPAWTDVAVSRAPNAKLQDRHVAVHGDTVHFDYMGKSGKRQVRELHDRRVARIVRELKQMRGGQLFKYRNDAGKLVKVNRQMINEDVKEVMGERFSAKDFRTWAGTMICANILARLHAEAVDGVTDRRKLLTAAVQQTAEQLGIRRRSASRRTSGRRSSP